MLQTRWTRQGEGRASYSLMLIRVCTGSGNRPLLTGLGFPRRQATCVREQSAVFLQLTNISSFKIVSSILLWSPCLWPYNTVSEQAKHHHQNTAQPVLVTRSHESWEKQGSSAIYASKFLVVWEISRDVIISHIFVWSQFLRELFSSYITNFGCTLYLGSENI